MRIAIAGSGGFIGSALTRHLRGRGHEIVRLVRNVPTAANERRICATERTIGGEGLSDIDAVINMSGAGIANARWTDARKRQLHDSRLDTTTTLVDYLDRSERCQIFLSGSAIGFYGDRADESLDESSSAGSGFLADLVQEWEAAATKAAARVACLRTGHVLGQGGILGKQKLIYQLGAGGRIGDGRQWVSWISIQDYVRATEHLLVHDVSGPVNLVGPAPVRNATFTRAFAQALHRPAVLPLPLPVARAMFGSEMVTEAMLASQRVSPVVLDLSGFGFVHRSIDEAIRAAVSPGASD